jgi:putative glutamine amidotransferase
VTRPAVAATLTYAKECPERFQLHRNYVRSVERAGALPLLVGAGRPEDAQLILDRVQGLLLTGGSDIDPSLFGQARHPAVKRVGRERDLFEIALAQEAVRRDLPVLAICRGQQVLNVALGGTLYQDVASEVPGAIQHKADTERHETSHDADLVPGSRVRTILGEARMAVNSFHHQAVRDVGRDLVVSARCPVDGIIEGLEAPGRRFTVAVQWHPEDFVERSTVFEPLFAAWAEACKQ